MESKHTTPTPAVRQPKPETWMASSYLQKGCDSHCSRKGLWKGACIVVKRPGYHCPLCHMLVVWALATWHIHLFHVRWLVTLHLHHKIAETHVRKSFHAPSCAQMLALLLLPCLFHPSSLHTAIQRPLPKFTGLCPSCGAFCSFKTPRIRLIRGCIVSVHGQVVLLLWVFREAEDCGWVCSQGWLLISWWPGSRDREGKRIPVSLKRSFFCGLTSSLQVPPPKCCKPPQSTIGLRTWSLWDISSVNRNNRQYFLILTGISVN